MLPPLGSVTVSAILPPAWLGVVIDAPPARTAETTAPLFLRPFTVDEYHRMAEAGVFGGDERLELLEGIVTMM